MEAFEKKRKKWELLSRFSANPGHDALYNLGSREDKIASQSDEQSRWRITSLPFADCNWQRFILHHGTIASTLSQFNLEADKASHIADVYAMAISKSQANMTKLSYSMSMSAP